VRLWADQLPTSPEARQVAEAMEKPIWHLALEGGDDYGLCFTAPPDAVEAISAAVARETGTSVSVIGEMLPNDQGRWLVLPDGQELPLATSWQHFQES
jgi:thiamine monophosphate kinase